MKFKNVKIGMKVQLKKVQDAGCLRSIDESKGQVVRVIDLDEKDETIFIEVLINGELYGACVPVKNVRKVKNVGKG